MPAEIRLKQRAAEPEEQRWQVRAMIARHPRLVVGSAGFHGPPDDRGRVEIGFHVVVAERRKGYAREGARALLESAAAVGGARTCAASVSPRNEPSLALVRAWASRVWGAQIDEVDGLE